MKHSRIVAVVGTIALVALTLGLTDFGKPYQESQLLDAIEPLVLARRQQIE